MIAQGAATSPHDWEVLASDLGVLIEHSPHDSPDRAVLSRT
ncbi:hypothetical protein [Saccharopolyspora pogona]|nr:hypothetical protein [Saccharopolyspora pogona]